jgi:hypothetical protein
MKLDRTRPYGEIFGGAGTGKYEQDGVTFNASGDPISIKLKDDPLPDPSDDPLPDSDTPVDGRKRRGRKAAV